MTLAIQMALRALKRALRDGCIQATNLQYGLRARAKRYLAEHPEILEAAAAKIQRRDLRASAMSRRDQP
jgi:hypothetical protein